MTLGLRTPNSELPATGLTKREPFAGLAMQGYIASPDTTYASYEAMAKDALKAADALLAELSK